MYISVVKVLKSVPKTLAKNLYFSKMILFENTMAVGDCKQQKFRKLSIRAVPVEWQLTSIVNFT